MIKKRASVNVAQHQSRFSAENPIARQIKKKSSYFSKRAQVFDTLLPWIVGIIILVIVFVAYMFISGKWNDGVKYFQTIWKFGR